MGKLLAKLKSNSISEGTKGGLLGGLCCILHAVALAIGFSAGATLFSQWMVDYRLYFLGAGMIYMGWAFRRSVKKHNISTKKALLTHLAVMVITFSVVFSLLNLYLFYVSG